MTASRTVVRRLRHLVNALLAKFDVQVERRSSLDAIGWNAPGAQPDTTPAFEVDALKLASLTEAYRGHPAAQTGLMWSEAFQAAEIDSARFRTDNAYLWQQRDHLLPVRYGLSALYARLFDSLGLWDRLSEDQLFGAYTIDIDGRTVSRDLLDSIIELNFLEESLGIGGRERVTVLDIGAGYGRLAHRATAGLPNLDYYCTDGIPLSTLLCEGYLDYRQAPRTRVIPLNEMEQVIRDVQFDVAVNIHSFSECPISAIEWWVQLLAEHQVRNLMVVPSGGLLSQELDGSRIDYVPLLNRNGYYEVLRRPKYAHSTFVQRLGVFPAEHYLFARA